MPPCIVRPANSVLPSLPRKGACLTAGASVCPFDFWLLCRFRGNFCRVGSKSFIGNGVLFDPFGKRVDVGCFLLKDRDQNLVERGGLREALEIVGLVGGFAAPLFDCLGPVVSVDTALLRSPWWGSLPREQVP